MAESSAELEERLAGDPDNLELWLELASALELEGNPTDAIALCREVVFREPDRIDARAMLARLTISITTSGEPARPPGVRTSRRATLRGLFSSASRERLAELDLPSADDSAELLASFDRTEGETLEPRARRGSVAEIFLSLFPGMTDDALEELTAGVKRRTFESGEIVLREGEPGDAFYMIEAGGVRVLKRDPAAPGGDFIDVSRLEVGDLFGEFAVLADRRRHATVAAVGELVVAEVSRALLSRLVRSYPELRPILESAYRERLLENLVNTAPFLQVIDKQRRRNLVEQFIPMRVSAGNNIVSEGARAGGFYLIVLGGVEITKTVGSSTVIPVATLREGDYFGELGLLRGDVARASVVAQGETELAMLPPQAFYDLVAEHPVLWEELRAEAQRRELELYQLVTGKTSLI